MKVWFAGETAQESARFGVLLMPGWNEYDEPKAKLLLAAKLVSKDEPKHKAKAGE